MRGVLKTYRDLIEQTFYYPTNEFKTPDNRLFFNDVDLMSIVEQYGTPIKITYLPRISENILRAKRLFQDAIDKFNYNGKYFYCYCTKSSHFSFVLEEALKNNIHIETSSAFDIPIVRKLHQEGKLTKETFIVCNGYKRPLYTQYISELINEGFNCIPILDNMEEINYYRTHCNRPYNVGIRVASDEEPNFAFYTSRLGVRYSDVNRLFTEVIKEDPNIKLRMLHFFVNKGIKDTSYYWSELSRFIFKYCELKRVCPELDSIDIGGGFPIINSLHFDYDYRYMTEQIVENVQWICNKNHVPVPNIFTEFGSFTVGESGAVIYSVLGEKLQNDKELWYMMDGSFITHLPDVWGLNEKFILLPINLWDNAFHKVNIGGLTCDSMDYYNSEAHIGEVFLPVIEPGQKLYFGFFHTGAYQESLGGFGGIQHCLIPSPKHVLIDRDQNGQIKTKVFVTEQDSDRMLQTLGY